LPRGGAAAIVGSALLVACSGTSLRLATGRGVPSSSDPPQIKGVRDIGSPVLAGKQRIPRSANDGVAVIGELLLVHGDGFGRQPRVVVDNRPTRTLARTTDGGIVVRVPWGVRSGKRLVKVRNSHGDSKRSFSFRRYALATVPSKDAIHPLEVAPARIRRLGKPLRVPSAHLVRYCAGGHIAYVSGRDGKGLLVATIDMVARGGPRIVGKRRVPGELLVALEVADRDGEEYVL